MQAGLVDRQVDDGALVLLTGRGRALAEGRSNLQQTRAT